MSIEACKSIEENVEKMRTMAMGLIEENKRLKAELATAHELISHIRGLSRFDEDIGDNWEANLNEINCEASAYIERMEGK